MSLRDHFSRLFQYVVVDKQCLAPCDPNWWFDNCYSFWKQRRIYFHTTYIFYNSRHETVCTGEDDDLYCNIININLKTMTDKSKLFKLKKVSFEKSKNQESEFEFSRFELLKNISFTRNKTYSGKFSLVACNTFCFFESQIQILRKRYKNFHSFRID